MQVLGFGGWWIVSTQLASDVSCAASFMHVSWRVLYYNVHTYRCKSVREYVGNCSCGASGLFVCIRSTMYAKRVIHAFAKLVALTLAMLICL